MVVAIIGSDGSGKSSLSADLVRRFDALGRAATHLYFGSGDGPSSLLRWPLRQVRRMLFGRKGRSERQQALQHRHPRTLGAARAVWAIVLAIEKQAKLSRALRSRRRGALVVCDRYPQAQVAGANDGPLLEAWCDDPRRLRRVCATWEARPYRRAERCPPDLVLRLRVDQSTAERRRPDHEPGSLRRRREIVAELRFPEARLGVIELDATRSYAEVVEEAQRAIEDGARVRRAADDG
jgi:thymidylate kinase